MPRTFQNLLDEARTLLQDEREPYRLSDETLLSKLNRGLQELARLRPDAFWEYYNEITGDVLVPEVVETDSDPDSDPTVFDVDEDGEIGVGADFPLSMQFYNALVYFVTASAELVDDEYTTDGRASMMMAQFKQQVVSL